MKFSERIQNLKKITEFGNCNLEKISGRSCKYNTILDIITNNMPAKKIFSYIYVTYMLKVTFYILI